MVKDLDDVLFKQNDYPWSDIKINKRMMRYFISLMFHYIMMGILEKKSIVERLKSFNEELESMIVLNECYIYKKDCDATSVSRILEVKFKKLSLRINKIKNLEEKKEQLKLFVEFNEKIRIILKALIKDVKSIIENYSSISEKKLNNIFNKLIVHQSTFILGGRRHQ
jgi:cell division FtsZ-interacting protein ZapD